MAQSLRIAVVGAGPAGLTFARILHQKAVEFQSRGHVIPWTTTVYEAEPSPSARRLGGTLDLGKKSGQAAIEAAGLLKEFNAYARPEAQELKAVTRLGEVILHKPGVLDSSSVDYSPEIDRADLNRILCESLPSDMVKWGHKLSKVDQVEDAYVLSFSNGNTVAADLVVGADSAWSRVRPLVSSVMPVYSGVTFVDCTVPDFDNRFPDLIDLVGTGSLHTFSQGTVLVTQRNGYGVLRLYVGVKVPEDWKSTSSIATAPSDTQRAELLIENYLKHWTDDFQKLVQAAGVPVVNDGVQASSSNMVPRALYAFPVGIKWDHRPGVVLIGDSAHLMSPCAGEGVNMAMLDALRLAEAIVSVESQVNFRSAVFDVVERFENEMFKRVEKYARRSAEALELITTEPEMTKENTMRRFGMSQP